MATVAEMLRDIVFKCQVETLRTPGDEEWNERSQIAHKRDCSQERLDRLDRIEIKREQLLDLQIQKLKKELD